MNFEQWWATLTIKEQTYIGKGTAKFVWSCAVEECAMVADETIDFWVKRGYHESAEVHTAQNIAEAIRAKGQA